MWQGSFFYYFVATWVMLNVWAIYGLVAYYGQNGNTGADPTSLSTFIVVNLQTMQLLIQVRMWMCVRVGGVRKADAGHAVLLMLDRRPALSSELLAVFVAAVLPRDDGGAAPGVAQRGA